MPWRLTEFHLGYSEVPKDTRIFNQEEYLIMELENKHQQIRLDTIERITVLDKVAEFKSIEINPAKK